MDLLIVYLWLAGSVAGAAIGEAKGLGAGKWFFLCLVFGMVAWFVLACLPRDEAELARVRIKAGSAKACPECASVIVAAAKVCPHCRTVQPPVSPPV